MPSRASANTSCLIPIGVGRGIVRTIRKTFEKYANIDSKLSQCEDWFGGTTTYTVVSELDDPTWPCIECLPKVVSDFVGEQSRVHIMPISAKWKHKSSIHIGFIVFNGGVTTFFCQECIFFALILKQWLLQKLAYDSTTVLPWYLWLIGVSDYKEPICSKRISKWIKNHERKIFDEVIPKLA